jgi:hypothetical protein
MAAAHAARDGSPMTLTANGPATARSRPARLAADIRATLYQAIADLAETALWLPGRYVAEHDRAADTLARMSGDLARAATALRGWPGYPPDWLGHSYAAATALATASQREPDLATWLAVMLATIPQGRGDLLAAVLAGSPGDKR